MGLSLAYLIVSFANDLEGLLCLWMAVLVWVQLLHDLLVVLTDSTEGLGLS